MCSAAAPLATVRCGGTIPFADATAPVNNQMVVQSSVNAERPPPNEGCGQLPMRITVERLLAACAEDSDIAGVRMTANLEPVSGPYAPIKPAIYAKDRGDGAATGADRESQYQHDGRWVAGPDGSPRKADTILVERCAGRSEPAGSVAAATVDPARPANAFWGKSSADGAVLPLMQHLFDTAAVGELLWDRFMASHQRDMWDATAGQRGRDVFVLLCGLHDVGKASPAFQSKRPDLARPLSAFGLDSTGLSATDVRWHHTLAGAHILRTRFQAAGWDAGATGLWWPFIAGHHGTVPGVAEPPGRGRGHGRGEAWRAAQASVVDSVVDDLGLDLAQMRALRFPSRGAQLALLGSLIMADWIASYGAAFPGLAQGTTPSLDSARERAATGWEALGLRGGWGRNALAVCDDPVRRRFGVPARPSQSAIVDLARTMPSPGLLIVEAPMGEGKTEAALAAAEVLGKRFGCNGVFVGMPTQATSDPMFSRVRSWAQAVDPNTPVALLHGKATLNHEWRELRSSKARITGVDEHGIRDAFSPSSGEEGSGQAPAEWFLGNKRGLLTPVVVGTIDQLLHAATRTRHVMLRHAGLAGKVVILDEVHAYDVYMSQFLFECLRWLADARVPVILLSATLPPGLRNELVRAYAQGLTSQLDVNLAGMPEAVGYPTALTAATRHGRLVMGCQSAKPWRAPLNVKVEVLPEGPDGSDEAIAATLEHALADGGVALVVRNTVGRAQETYRLLAQRYGADVQLLHGRLTAGERANRSEQLVRRLGPPRGRGGQGRPKRLIVVATQVAEQSFDVDVDLLITDIAPIDLLLQRIGRLHRHDRPDGQRPERVSHPRVIVTGFTPRPGAAPYLAPGCEAVYGAYPLLRSASLVLEAEALGGWTIPTDVPTLVARGYADGDPLPHTWEPAADAARHDWQNKQQQRRENARQFLLAGEDQLGKTTLAGLHERCIADLPDDDAVAAVVRDGDPSIEAILVRMGAHGLTTLEGRPLGPTGESVSDADVLDEVLRDCVRLPAALTEAAKAELGPLPGWIGDPWLGRSRVVLLDESGAARLGAWQIQYSQELGLQTSKGNLR